MISFLDGVDDPAHAVLSGRLEKHPDGDLGIVRDQSKLIAFYLPQFHRIPENSDWWGPGFTEWHNVVRARPNFEDHYQPHIPRELGFYDLTYVDVMREQAELASLFGIYGFCFHYYWFSGRRILELPVDNFLKSDIDINFCLCWANENWTRTWDGDNEGILLEQKYAEGDETLFINSLIEAFSDSRYIKVNGKPLLVVYRAKHIPNPVQSFDKWRAEALRHGFPGLHISVVDFYDITDPHEVGADALIEFPPHKFAGPFSHPDQIPKITNPLFYGGIVDYAKITAISATRQAPDFMFYRGIVPSWDNTARRQNNPTIIVNASPTLYGSWLRYLRAYNRHHTTDETHQLIFVNAWNEWAEGCHLEPDLCWGMQYLEQTYQSAFYDAAIHATGSENELAAAREALLKEAATTVLLSKGVNEAGTMANNPDEAEVRAVAATLSDYPQPGKMARSIATVLSKWPRLFQIGKKVYVFSRRLRG